MVRWNKRTIHRVIEHMTNRVAQVSPRVPLHCGIVLLAIAIGGAGALAGPPERADSIDKLMTTLHERGQFNGAILVAEQGNVLYKKGFGMRKLKIMEHISLDGVIEVGIPGDGGDFPYGDWTAPYRTPEGFAKVAAMYGERFDLLIGRRTYDQWSGFWPKAPRSPMAERLNAATKYVVTHRPESLEWGPVECVGPDFLEGVRAIKEKDGADLIVSGSSSLTSALLEHGLADELVLLVDPVLLGKGKRLFAEGTPPRAFTLKSTEAMPSGIVIQTYKAAGPLQNLR